MVLTRMEGALKARTPVDIRKFSKGQWATMRAKPVMIQRRTDFMFTTDNGACNITGFFIHLDHRPIMAGVEWIITQCLRARPLARRLKAIRTNRHLLLLALGASLSLAVNLVLEQPPSEAISDFTPAAFMEINTLL